MRNICLLVILVLPFVLNAQIEATTSEGKAVLLFEDGTWEYVTEDNTQTIDVATVEIAEGVSKESPLGELYYAESKRLVKYFGPVKGKIKGRAKCMIEDGTPKVFFQWELGLLDSYRYYGQMKPGKKVTLKTKSNATIDLVLTEDVDIEFMEKYKFSILKGTAVLSDEQFNLMMSSPVTEMEVEWKKESETYKVDDSYFFSRTFTDLLK
ncbi:hypothetical protein [Labilibacter marinus]|uniref:hypothetical protein n=1 Tax=Labilibacter marinus TaxID=1477105 RepID=UPI00117A19F0|nr:hypothetical protein [Labilibacter marinus]